MRRRKWVEWGMALIIGCTAIWAVLWQDLDAAPRTGAEPVRVTKPTGTSSQPVLVGSPQPRERKENTAVQPTVRRVYSGRVLSLRSRSPVGGCRVFLAERDSREIPLESCLRTAEDGSFALESDRQVDKIHLVADGFRAWSGWDPGLLTERGAELLLDEGGRASGKVLDLRGDPVPGVRVWCTPVTNRAAWPHPSRYVSTEEGVGGVARTDEAGEFRIAGLDHGTPYRIYLAKERMTPVGWVYATPVQAGDEGIVLRLRREGAGLLVPLDRETKQPVQAVSLLWSGVQGVIPGARGAPWGEEPRDGFESGHAFLFAESDDGMDPRIRVRARAPGYQDVTSEVAVDFEEGVNRVEIPLTPLDMRAHGEVALRAHFAGGSSYSGALSIDITRAGNLGEAEVVFEDGHATHRLRLPPGNYTAMPHGYGTGTTWQSAGLPVDFTVEPGGEHTVSLALRGSQYLLNVSDAQGRTVRGFDLWAYSGRRRGGAACWDLRRRLEPGGERTGPLRLTLPPGRIHLIVQLRGVAQRSLWIEAGEDGTAVPLDVVLEEPFPR